MAVSFLLTCEHAGNEIPAEYQTLFSGAEEVLYSHKAIDFGALQLAKKISSETKLPLYYTSTSRLLVEANRSLDNEELFSKYTKQLPEEQKNKVLEQFYFPHRKEVEQQVRQLVEAGQQVVHFAIHTFTPVMDGEVREADVGILFDPDRASEVTFAALLKEKVLQKNAARKVLDNSPYPGVDDGFPTYLRTKFAQVQYAGFELEINQKFFLCGEPEVWQNLMEELTSALKEVTLSS